MWPLFAGGGYYAPGSELDEQTTDPEMFMLPLPPGLPGDQYRVKLSFFHPMLFDMQQGKYVLRLPTTIPQVRVLKLCACTNLLVLFGSCTRGWHLYVHSESCSRIYTITWKFLARHGDCTFAVELCAKPMHAPIMMGGVVLFEVLC